MQLLRIVVVVSGALLAACSSDGETAVTCCPIDGPPCGCNHIGGSPRPDGTCEELCDGHPTGSSTTIDRNGCPVWHPGPGSCFDRDSGLLPDVSTDADAGDAADAQETGDGAPDAVDATDSAETG